MKKEGIAKLFFTLIIFTFLLSSISAAATIASNTCDIVAAGDCTGADYHILMGTSSTTNSHGQVWGQTPAYTDVVCCNFGTASPTCSSSSSIIHLSSLTNAHAEAPDQTNYATNICYGDLQCAYTSSSSCPSTKPIPILSLSAPTNAHIGKFADYPVKICCSGTLTQPCFLSDAYWGVDKTIGSPEAVKGVTKSLSVVGSGSECASKELALKVYKKGLLSGTAVDSSQQPSNIFFDSNGSAVGSWDTSNADIGSAYYFVTNLVTTPSATKQSNDLTIKDPACYSTISSCEDYETNTCSTNPQADCQNDAALANVAITEIESTQGTGFCSTHNCFCSWDASQPSGKKCNPTYSSTPQTGCGNGIQETGEQCDLGSLNGQPGSGCSSTCTLVGTQSSCTSGLTLCSDGTCSLGDCLVTDTNFSTCNYNGVCDVGEGASCSDCNGQQDTCIAGLIANTSSGLNGPACCKTTSDGVCTLGCESVDPDCAGTGGACSTSSDCSSGASCINRLCYIPTNTCTGVTCPTGSTCNSGICVDGSGNPINTCTGVTCPTGSTCADSSGTCVIGSGTSCTLDSNCANGEVCRNNKCVTNGGGTIGAVCGNGKLEFGEQCDLGSLNGQPGSGCSSTCTYTIETPPCGEGLILCSDGTCSLNCFATDHGLGDCLTGSCCKTGLIYDKISLACCNPVSDGKCNQHCAYSDPDCGANLPPYEPGTCTISQTVTKNCNIDPIGYKTLTWTGVWSGTQSGVNYQKCVVGGTVTVPCPAQVQLPFFDYLELIGSILIIALIYVGLVFKRKILRKK